MPAYALHKQLDTTFEDALERVREALPTEGFGVLTEIDVKGTLKKKLDVEFRKYVILGACNPPLAKRALEADLDVGVLLPCNVCVWEDEQGRATVAAMDPVEAMGKLSGNADLVRIASEVRGRLERVLEKV